MRVVTIADTQATIIIIRNSLGEQKMPRNSCPIWRRAVIEDRWFRKIRCAPAAEPENRRKAIARPEHMLQRRQRLNHGLATTSGHVPADP